MRATPIVIIALTLLARLGSAQDAVPSEILYRTVPIIAGDQGGTGFFLDSRDKIYLITARHVVSSLPSCDAQISIWFSDQWKTLTATRVLVPNSDADIAVIETEWKPPKPFLIPAMHDQGTDGPTFGQQVWFLGYPLWSKDHPHGLSSSLANISKILPFIRRGTLSAIDSSNPKSTVLYIDGINNKGFSGGPIVYWSFSAHEYRILGVIHGYVNEEVPQEWTINGQKVNEIVLANSGILIGYSITQAVDTIKASETLNQCRP